MSIFNMTELDIHLGLKLPDFSKGATAISSSASSTSTASSKSTRNGLPELDVTENVDTMKMKYTLNIPIDDLFGSIRDTSLEKSDGFNEYVDRVVMDNFSSLADDLYFDW